MRSTLFRLLLPAILCLPLLSTACASSSTLASIGRTDRPALPPPATELAKTERIAPLSTAPAGDLVTIDRAVLGELTERLAEAVGAVERGNHRIVGWIAERRCLAAIWSTGSVPAGCGRADTALP